MNKRIHIGLAVAAFLGIAGYAAAQTIPVPQVQTLNPNNDVIQVIPGGAPAANEVFAPPALITNVYGYYKSVPATGMQYAFAKNVTFAAFAPAGTIANFLVSLAANPSDGARNCIFTTQIMTSLIVSPTTAGQLINNAINGTLAANTSVCYLFSASNATWDRD
jgi:hypothetical protein